MGFITASPSPSIHRRGDTYVAHFRALAHRHIRELPAFIIVFASVVCFGTVSHALPILGPDMEPQIDRLVTGQNGRPVLPGGWRVAEYHFTDFDIHVTLSSAAGQSINYRLSCTTLPSDGVLVGESHNFRIERMSMDNTDSDVVLEVSRAFLTRVREHDSPNLLTSREMKNPESLEEYIFRKYLLTPLLACGLLYALFLVVANHGLIRETMLPDSRAGVFLLVLLAAAAVVLRLWLCQEAPIHNNGHGIREIRAIIYPGSPEEKELMYGQVYLRAMQEITRVTGKTDIGIFRSNAVFGGLAVASMFLLGMSLLQDEKAAASAAFLMCTGPAQVWLSGSESPIALFLFTGLAGLAFAVQAKRACSQPLLHLAAILLAFAATMRFTTLLIVPAGVLLFLYTRSGNESSRKNMEFRWHAATCLALVSLWCLFHILSLDSQNLSKGVVRMSPGLYWYNMRQFNLLFDSNLTPLAVPALAAAGYAAAWFSRPRFALVISLLFLMIVPVSFTTMADRTDLVRYQPPTYWIYYLAAGFPIAFLHSKAKWRRAAAALAAAIILVSAMQARSGLTLLLHGNEEQEEYKFMKQSALLIPGHQTIHLPPAYRLTSKLSTEFPDYTRRHEISRSAPPPTSEGSVFYRGLDCYRFDNMKEKERFSDSNGMRLSCEDLCAGRQEILKGETLSAPHYVHGFDMRYFILGSRSPRVDFSLCYSVVSPSI